MNAGHLTAIASALAAAALGVALGMTASPGAAGPPGAAASSGTAASSRTASRTASVTLDAAAARAATPWYVLYDCASKGRVKPTSEVLTCADAGMILEGLHWATWTPRFAAAYGILSENDCQPSCAGGHFHSYPVVVTAWGSASVPGHPGQRRYTQLTLVFTGSRPPRYTTVNGKVAPAYPVAQTLPAI